MLSGTMLIPAIRKMAGIIHMRKLKGQAVEWKQIQPRDRLVAGPARQFLCSRSRRNLDSSDTIRDPRNFRDCISDPIWPEPGAGNKDFSDSIFICHGNMRSFIGQIKTKKKEAYLLHFPFFFQSDYSDRPEIFSIFWTRTVESCYPSKKLCVRMCLGAHV